MEIPRRKLTSATALSSALVLIVALAVLGADLMKVGDEREPRIMQTSRYLSQQRAIFQSGERQTDCSRARGDGNTPGASKELSAERNVMSAKGGGESSSAPLARCSSGTLLGGWDNETFVPLPYDSLAPFLAEARGGLSRAERSFFVEQRDGVDVPPRYLPVNYPVGASAKTPEEEPFAFSPPCYYHFYSKDEILRLFAGKWVYLFGDSNTRGMILGLLAILDPDHRSPYSAAKWFNGTTEDVEWPHVYRAHYFFREDGSILFKTGARHHPPPLPESGYSFRLSFRMTFVRAPLVFLTGNQCVFRLYLLSGEAFFLSGCAVQSLVNVSFRDGKKSNAWSHE